MPSRRAQRREGTRKSRGAGDYWERYLEAEYAHNIAAWMLARVRPADPPIRKSSDSGSAS